MTVFETRQRATLYVRLSNAATETNLSKEGMVADLRELAARLNCDVIAVHIDDGMSGEIRDRPEFLSWLRDARDGRADVMLAWSGDRLTREGINAAAMVLDVVEGKDPVTGKVVRLPVRFVSYDDHLDSEEGDAFRWRFVIAAEVARGERKRMVARSQARARRMFAEGRYVGSVPYGYLPDPDHKGRLIVEPSEAAVLQEAARRVLAGTSPNQVARSMNAAGIKTRRDHEWVRVTLLHALMNPANAGQPTRPGGWVRPAILRFSDVTEIRRRYEVKPTGTRGGARAPRTSKAMLAELLICHDCQHPMRSSSSRMVCMTAADGGTCGGAVSIMLTVAEPAVEAAYLDRWGRLPELRHEIIISGASERDALELEHAALMARLSASPDPDDFAKLQANAAARAALDEQPTTRTVRTVATGRTRADAWASATPEDRRDLLKDAYEYITCYPRSVRPRLVFTERPEVSELSVDEFGDVM